jgi:hypothetical protein
MTTKIKELKNRSYVGKDFDSLRANLLTYARQYYPDKIQDFSEASFGGLMLDMMAYVGDVLTFYQDHQFLELDPETVSETDNLERILRSSGVTIPGASPSTVDLTFYISIPANSGVLDTSCIPVIKTGTICQSSSGVQFILAEDIDFSEKYPSGQYIAVVTPGVTSNGTIKNYVMSRVGTCVSGQETTETFRLDGFTPFRRITLGNPHVHEILSVTDGIGNKYYQVSSLVDDTVYVNLPNLNSDSDQVNDIISVIPAPYRFMTEVSLSDRATTMILGGGSAETFEDDVIPDPSEFAIPMKYKKTFSRISINPSQLLNTKTMGIAASDTTLSVTYRYGGGLSHVVPPNSVQVVSVLDAYFPSNPSASLARQVRDSVQVTNLGQSKGGDDAPTPDDLKSLIPAARSSQDRIVSREDLLARIYSMPSNFGRVFRAMPKSNPNNPLSIQLHVVSRDSDSRLVTCPDTLKKNLRKYLNPYRMISDSIEVLDVRVINLRVKFEVFVDPSLNKSLVLQSCLDTLKSYFDIKNWQIDQPIIVSDVMKVITAIPGVLSVQDLNFVPVSGLVDNLEYSDEAFDVGQNQQKNIIMTPQAGGSIFEVRYPTYDITGKAI